VRGDRGENYEKCQKHIKKKITNLLTLLAADPPSSCELVLLCLLSCFPHLCWVPTVSFYQSRVDCAPLPCFPADQFQEALDPGNCLFSVGHNSNSNSDDSGEFMTLTTLNNYNLKNLNQCYDNQSIRKI
jgi:hypothetical protein